MKIELLVQKIHELKEEIKAIKESIKNIEPKSSELEELKKKRKEFNKEIKEIQEDLERQMNEDKDIRDFREKLVLKKEALSEKYQDLFGEIRTNNKEFDVDVTCGEKVVKVQTEKDFNVYFNGKEVKKIK